MLSMNAVTMLKSIKEKMRVRSFLIFQVFLICLA